MKRGVVIVYLSIVVALVVSIFLVMEIKKEVLFGPGEELVVNQIILSASSQYYGANQNLTLFVNASGDGQLVLVGDWYKNGVKFGPVVTLDKKISFSGSDTYGYDLDADDNGNMYVGGLSSVPGQDHIFLSKIDSSGNVLWANQWPKETLNNVENLFVKRDPYSNRIFLTYNLYGAPPSLRVFLDNGTLEKNITMPSMFKPKDIDLDSNGDMYLLTYNSSSYSIRKFDSGLNQVGNFDLLIHPQIIPGTIIINYDAMKIFQNAIYVAGDLIGDSINRGKEYLAKYDFAGVMIWNASNVGINYDGGGGVYSHRLTDVSVDSFGNPYIYYEVYNKIDTSITIVSAGIAKFDSNGVPVWSAPALAGYNAPSPEYSYIHSGFSVNGAGDSNMIFPYQTPSPTDFGVSVNNYYANGSYIGQKQISSVNKTNAGWSSVFDSFGNFHFMGTGDSLNGAPRLWLVSMKDRFVRINQVSGQLSLTNVLTSNYLTVGDNWSACIRVFNGTAYSAKSCSNNLQVEKTSIIITLNVPDRNEILYSRNVSFNWTASDNFGAMMNCSLTIEGNSLSGISGSGGIAGGGCGGGSGGNGYCSADFAEISVTSGVATNYTIKNFTNGNYSWRVSCSDNTPNTNTSETRNFTILVVPAVALTNPARGYSAIGPTTIPFQFGFANLEVGEEFIGCNFSLNGEQTGINGSEINLSGVNTITRELGVGEYSWNVGCVNNTSGVLQSETRMLSITQSPSNNEGSSNGGGGGGGGGKRCLPNWTCSWQACSGNVQYQTCNDKNYCNVTTNKPAGETRACNFEGNSLDNPLTLNNETSSQGAIGGKLQNTLLSSLTNIFLIALFLTIFILVIVIVIIFIRNKRKSKGQILKSTAQSR
ncbi:hypothetical protein J4233_06055 [Candidatus Pacearchaeota archaeon]|nr:hypothetical protein [Candidatus Pacearchaeota archaeon]